jgi:hypothetical protein
MIMNIKIIHHNSGINEKYYEFYHVFIKFLQKKFTLSHDIKIYFLEKKLPNMTTGKRTDNHCLYILAKHRLNRDIMRTLAHEWIHEYQHSIQHRKKLQDIGGPLEDEANAKSGALMKEFERAYPEESTFLYQGTDKTLYERIKFIEKLIQEAESVIKNK